MIVAGVGCRAGCAAAAIVAVVRLAAGEAGVVVGALAAPEWKRGEAGLLGAAAALGLPIVFVGEVALAAVQGACVTRSAAVLRAVGAASVAEGVALAASGGPLLLARVGAGLATCAVAGR